MDFILDNIYLIVLAAAGIAQWLKATKEAKTQNQDEPDPTVFREPVPYETYEEQIPRPVLPPPLPNLVSTPPPLISVRRMEEELARQEALKEKLNEAQRAKKRKADAKTAAAEAQKSKAETSSGSIRSALSNRRETRRAFILKEILDPPVGMR